MKIELITEDFKGSSYTDSSDCPLARALIRLFGGDVRVSGFGMGHMNDKVFTFAWKYDWNARVANPLIDKADSGEEVSYSLEIVGL